MGIHCGSSNKWEAVGLMKERRTPEREVWGSILRLRVVSLSKIHLLPKITGNTQEVVAPSRYN